MDFPILGTAITIALALIPAIWKCGKLQSEIYDEIKEKVSIAIAGLSENASQCLLKLRSRIDEAVNPEGENFEPGKVVADPALLKTLVNRYLNYLKHRKRIGLYYKVLLYVGPSLVVLLFIALLAIVTYLFQKTPYALSYFQIENVAAVIASLSLALSSFVFVAYLILRHSVSSAVILADKDESSE